MVEQSGTYTWVDFSGTDIGVSLEVEDIDVSGLTTGAVFFDYYQDWGTYGPASPPNILNVEVYDSSAAAWTIIGTIQAESAGWETHAFTLPSYTGTIAEIRFTAESGGLSSDFYGDILLDDVKVQDAILGCTDPLLITMTLQQILMMEVVLIVIHYICMIHMVMDGMEMSGAQQVLLQELFMVHTLYLQDRAVLQHSHHLT